jgi:cytochrome c-type biogenesis protein CcmH
MILSIALMTGLMLLALGLILWPMAQRQLLSRQRFVGLVLILPSMAIALYALIGTPQLIMQHAVPQAQSAQMTELIDRLAARLTQQPDDLAGWQLLANSHLVNGQLAQAER